MLEKRKGPERIKNHFVTLKLLCPAFCPCYAHAASIARTENCLSTGTLVVPDQWRTNLEIHKVHRCSSLKCRCCELLSHSPSTNQGQGQSLLLFPRGDRAHASVSASLLDLVLSAQSMCIPWPVSVAFSAEVHFLKQQELARCDPNLPF